MSKRSDSNFKALRGKPADFDGNRMGLTEAFAPIDVSGADGTGNSMGLTEAFAPIEGAHAAHRGAHAAGSKSSASSDEVPRGKHAKHARQNEDLTHDDSPQVGSVNSARNVDPCVPRDKQKRTRKVLIGSAILIVALIAALGFGVVKLFDESKMLASQQTQEQQGNQEVEALQQESTTDASSAVSKQTEVVVLTVLLGKSQDEAIAAIGHGATITTERDVDDEDNPVKKELVVSLSDEPADARTGVPSVYLSLDEDGVVVRAGYSASTTALGYGAFSFTDAVNSEHIVEKTLFDAGLEVQEGSVALPEDKAAYQTYAGDGSTLTKERYSFSGTGKANGAEYSWDAVLLYDYVAANASGNLDDTIRSLYVYINA